MFQKLKKFLTKTQQTQISEISQPYIPHQEELTFESLWDDYEKRTWQGSHKETLSNSSNIRLENWIGSIDQSGYTREKCLQSLINNRVSGDENRILLRLSDWVPQVQAIARAWVIAHFHTLTLTEIKANQRLILYLSRKEKLKDDDSIHEIKRDLLARTRAMNPRQFFEFIPMFRRFLFSLSLAHDEHLRPWILKDPEPFNRLLLLSQFEFSEINENEKIHFRKDKSNFVRRRFIYSLLKSGVIPDKEELIQLALHPSRSLRELGQFHLKSSYSSDAYTMYLSMNGDDFFYISDYARAEDTEHFLEGIHSQSINTQYNCLRALIRTAPERLKELEISTLLSQNRKFRATLLPLLPSLLSVEEIMALRSIFENSSPQGSVSFFNLLVKKSFWIFVDEGLTALLSNPEPELRKSIIKTIRGKLSIYETLPLQLRESINTKVSRLYENNPKRNEQIAAHIRFILKTE